MTPALKAMVEAMVGEMRAQCVDEYDDRTTNSIADHGDPRFLIDGYFDLEKVARAGLAAIREPGQEIADRVCDRCNLDDVIDEILKETP